MTIPLLLLLLPRPLLRVLRELDLLLQQGECLLELANDALVIQVLVRQRSQLCDQRGIRFVTLAAVLLLHIILPILNLNQILASRALQLTLPFRVPHRKAAPRAVHDVNADLGLRDRPRRIHPVLAARAPHAGHLLLLLLTQTLDEERFNYSIIALN